LVPLRASRTGPGEAGEKMGGSRTKNEGASAGAGNICDTCGSTFPTPDALKIHLESSPHRHGKPASSEEEALSFAPGGTVADFETGPRPGGKMDRETSRPAKRWESPGEEGEPRKGVRNEGVAPIEFPDPVTEGTPSEGSAPRKPHKKSADGR
jgi:hypothetical protein